MKFNVEAKGYHESMHHYWRIYSLRLYNGKVPNYVIVHYDSLYLQKISRNKICDNLKTFIDSLSTRSRKIVAILRVEGEGKKIRQLKEFYKE